MSARTLSLLIAFTGLSMTACLGDAVDPRPLPRPALDGALFDARTPPSAPGYGSGSGSGAPAPSGPSGQGSRDAEVDYDGESPETAMDAGADAYSDAEEQDAEED